MKNIDKTCPICGSQKCREDAVHYMHCNQCGYEFRADDLVQTYMMNDMLSAKSIQSNSMLDRFRKKISMKCATAHEFLIDIGSASGKFLFNNAGDFNDHLGIEITPECIEFSRTLGLRVSSSIDSLNANISFATFWHSLEHIPFKEIIKIFHEIRLHSDDATRIVISVPNTESLTYRILKNKYSFYDWQNHIHQFSLNSLDILMDKFGFTRKRLFFSFPYSFFNYLQSILNICNIHHNYFYYTKKRGILFYDSKYKNILMDVYNTVLIGFFCIPSLILTVHDVLFKQYGGVLTACYGRRKK